MARKLALTVYLDGEQYVAGSTPPADVAERIGADHPHAWQKDEKDGDAAAAKADTGGDTGGGEGGGEGAGEGDGDGSASTGAKAAKATGARRS